MDEEELNELFTKGANNTPNVRICGLMGMASFTEDMDKVRSEFRFLKSLFDKYFIQNPQGAKSPGIAESQESVNLLQAANKLPILSMGMSADYKIAIEEGSNMVRIGSLLFGNR